MTGIVYKLAPRNVFRSWVEVLLEDVWYELEAFILDKKYLGKLQIKNKDYVLEHTGLKVSNLYITQVKQKCCIIERVNYNQPKFENSRQPKCPPEKEAAIREALVHFRMI